LLTIDEGLDLCDRRSDGSKCGENYDDQTEELGGKTRFCAQFGLRDMQKLPENGANTQSNRQYTTKNPRLQRKIAGFLLKIELFKQI
jgi:hypothetical protein